MLLQGQTREDDWLHPALIAVTSLVEGATGNAPRTFKDQLRWTLSAHANPARTQSLGGARHERPQICMQKTVTMQMYVG